MMNAPMVVMNATHGSETLLRLPDIGRDAPEGDALRDDEEFPDSDPKRHIRSLMAGLRTVKWSAVGRSTPE
jgi:hypothetical protein